MTTPAPRPTTEAPEHRRRLRFTVDQYWFLARHGLVPKRSEFVDGEIYELPAAYTLEGVATGRISAALRDAWHSADLVGTHATHVFPSGWMPMPDVVVLSALPPRRPGPGTAYPAPRLIVEVAEDALDYDLGEKARRYAAESVEELWVADVAARRLHVFREPTGGDWRVRLLLEAGESVSPLCLPDAALAVADLLPDLYGAGSE